MNPWPAFIDDSSAMSLYTLGSIRRTVLGIKDFAGDFDFGNMDSLFFPNYNAISYKYLL